VLLNLKEIYSLMSFLAINNTLQSSEPRDKNKQTKNNKKDAIQPIRTSKNNILIVKLHAVLKHIIIHTICNCLVLLLKKKSFQILYNAQYFTIFFPSLNISAVLFIIFCSIIEKIQAQRSLKKKKNSPYRTRQYSKKEI